MIQNWFNWANPSKSITGNQTTSHAILTIAKKERPSRSTNANNNKSQKKSPFIIANILETVPHPDYFYIDFLYIC